MKNKFIYLLTVCLIPHCTICMMDSSSDEADYSDDEPRYYVSINTSPGDERTPIIYPDPISYGTDIPEKKDFESKTKSTSSSDSKSSSDDCTLIEPIVHADPIDIDTYTPTTRDIGVQTQKKNSNSIQSEYYRVPRMCTYKRFLFSDL